MTLGFRELSNEEIDFVAGSTIVVTGTRIGGTPYAAGVGQIGGMGSWRSGDASAREDAEEYDPDGDDDGDGTENQFEEIVVTAPGTPQQAAIALQIAQREVDNFLFIAGALAGVAGLELGVLLRAIGMSPIAVNALLGGAAAVGAPTSLADLIAEGRDDLIQRVSVEIIRDMQANPDQYRTWLLNPFTGEYFDANDRQYNQND